LVAVTALGLRLIKSLTAKSRQEEESGVPA
jgi:hypothetical protein